MRNSTRLILTLLTTCLFLKTGYAVKEEVVANIGDRPITNIEVFENISLESHGPNYRCKPHYVKYRIKDMLPVILFEQYAAKNGITITEQEVGDLLTASASARGRTLE